MYARGVSRGVDMLDVSLFIVNDSLAAESGIKKSANKLKFTYVVMDAFPANTAHHF